MWYDISYASLRGNSPHHKSSQKWIRTPLPTSNLIFWETLPQPPLIPLISWVSFLLIHSTMFFSFFLFFWALNIKIWHPTIWQWRNMLKWTAVFMTKQYLVTVRLPTYMISSSFIFQLLRPSKKVVVEVLSNYTQQYFSCTSSFGVPLSLFNITGFAYTLYFLYPI